VRLAPWHRRSFYVGFAITWLSGALWIIEEYIKNVELGPVRTPLQTVSMKIHGAGALLSLVLIGSLLIHVRRGWAQKANRWSGSLVIMINCALLFTAWLLYYETNDTWREVSSVTHWVLGLATLPLIYLHIFYGRKKAKKNIEWKIDGRR